MKEIEQYQTITFKKQFYNAGQAIPCVFTQFLNLPFQPDEIVVKSISMNLVEAHPTNTMTLLKSNIIDFNGVLGAIPYAAAFYESYNIPFKNQNKIIGDYQFSLTDINDNVFDLIAGD